MEYAKAMDSIFGLMEVYIKEILVMVKDMDSEYGTMKINRILALIKWIKNPGKKRDGYPQMPRFEGQIEEADLDKLADFILQMK